MNYYENPSYCRGFYDATDKILNILNSIDTETLNSDEVKNLIYDKLMDIKPYTLENKK